MPDNKDIKGPADQKRINVNEPYEVRYWTKELSINEATLRRAVREAGVMSEKVRQWLNEMEHRYLIVN